MSAGPGAPGGRGPALMIEHLPDIRFRHSSEGGLLIVFTSGEVYFYPLNEHTKGDSLASQETQMSRPDKSSGNQKYTVYDVPLDLNENHHRVFTFAFNTHPETSMPMPPKKILLSPSRRHILIHGANYRGRSSLLVYEISDDVNDFFRLIYHDLAIAFTDVCFSPDAFAIAGLPARFPGYVVILTLGLNPLTAVTTTTSTTSVGGGSGASGASATPTAVTSTADGAGDGDESGEGVAGAAVVSSALDAATQPQARMVPDFQPRPVGPIFTCGPATDCFGLPSRATRIAANPCAVTDSTRFSYVTWSEEDGMGEYTLWTVSNDSPDGVAYAFYSRQLRPFLYSENIPEDKDSPKTYVLDAQFRPEPKHPDDCLLFLVKHDNYKRGNENGMGLEMAELNVPDGDARAAQCRPTTWYKVTDSRDPRDVLSVKWSETLLLGTTAGGAVVIKDVGLFELVDKHFGSAFQALYDTFVSTVSNVVQVGSYHRFWVANSGELRVILVSPEMPASHPEWRDLFDSDAILDLRVLGRRVGYFINDVRDVDPLHSAASSWKASAVGMTDGDGLAEKVVGLHLHRCAKCRRALLRPLVCSSCNTTVYCGRECQREDWYDHPCSGGAPTTEAATASEVGAGAASSPQTKREGKKSNEGGSASGVEEFTNTAG